MVISIKLQGGLGNQLFQIATAFSYSIKHKRKLVFPERLLVEDRSTYWDTLFYPLKRFIGSIPEVEYTEPQFSFQELPKFSKHTTLVGYFQSYKYFHAERDKIIKKLNLINEPNDYISIHFRYGDYKNLQECHPLLGYDYYKKRYNTR